MPSRLEYYFFFLLDHRFRFSPRSNRSSSSHALSTRRSSGRLGSRTSCSRSSARGTLCRHDHVHPVADDGLDGTPRVNGNGRLSDELPVDGAREGSNGLTRIRGRDVSHSNEMGEEDGGQEGASEAEKGSAGFGSQGRFTHVTARMMTQARMASSTCETNRIAGS